ncbi:MAG TPA: HAMP domain-containing sensor histidine kinase [Anaerolineales bacterium]|nr:HAMP domain-containing sensor histidine kinase [Anaerolineales bacterium]
MLPPLSVISHRTPPILKFLNRPWKIVVAFNLAALLAAIAIMLATSGGVDLAVLAVIALVATATGAFLSWTLKEYRAWNVAQNEALRQVNEELELRYKDLEAFSFTVAHDLKTPIAAILGYTYLLRVHNDKVEGDPVYIAGEIEEAAEKMSEIIDSILVLASVGIQKAEIGPLPMDQIMANIEKRLEQTIAQAKAEIVVPSRWPPALGYAPWIEQVLVNYITNGIKYGGSPPRVVLEAEPEGDFVRFSVCDNGHGIPPEDQDKLFIEFTRLDHGRTDGHGLGLAIVRRVLEKLGGEYGVESEPGKGSTFYFKLPGM